MCPILPKKSNLIHSWASRMISCVWPVERDLLLLSISCGFESMRKKRNKCHVDCTARKRVSWLVIPWHHGFGRVKDIATTFIFYIGMPVVWTDRRMVGVRSREYQNLSDGQIIPNLLRYEALGSTSRSVLVFFYSYRTCWIAIKW